MNTPARSETPRSRRKVPASAKRPLSRPGARKEKVVKSTVRDLVPHGGSALDNLLSGKVVGAKSTKRGGGKKKKAAEPLPGELSALGDVLVAGRKIEREIEFKVRFASNKIKDYCLRRFCERFAETGHRPESTTYASRNAVFTFIQTKRVTLTPEKVEALKMLKVPVDQFTELKGIHINFEAIRAHRLETKLRDALAQMGVAKDVLQEVFHPNVQLKEGFFEHLSAVVSRTLKPHEDLAAKIYDVLKVLDPTEQIRSADSPLNPVQSFKLIHDARIEVSEDLDALED